MGTPNALTGSVNRNRSRSCNRHPALDLHSAAFGSGNRCRQVRRDPTRDSQASRVPRQ